jgi:hypothetical protein
MSIVGKTLMVVLFGEPVGHEHEVKPETAEEKVAAAMDLFAKAGVISEKSASMLKDLPKEELSYRLKSVNTSG